MNKIMVGSRESRLAIAQTKLFIRALHAANEKSFKFKLCTMKTSGDLNLGEIAGKGLFVRELDIALLENKIDFAVHSLKDVPLVLEKGLKIVAYSDRADVRDVLILPKNKNMLDENKSIGCSSKRRVLQLQNIFSNVKTAPIRGNIITRIKKLNGGEYGALVLAAAGIKRLGLEKKIFRYFNTAEMLPAAGQGIMCAVIREGSKIESLFDNVNARNEDTRLCAIAERSFVNSLGGNCSLPTAAYAEITGGELKLTGLYYPDLENPKKFFYNFITGNKNDAEKIGTDLAKEALK